MTEIEKKQRHHFVSAFYLRGFSDLNDQVWVYDKTTAGKVFSGKPEKIGYEKHYHSFEKSDGARDTNSIENFLCEMWEGPGSRIFKTIESGDFPKGEDRQFFACFLGLSFTRSPNYRRNLDTVFGHAATSLLRLCASNSDYFYRSLSDCEKQLGERLTDDPESLRRFILDGKAKFTTRPEVFLRTFMDHGVRVGGIIEKMRWQFVRSTDRFSYMTSDNPFFFSSPTDNPDHSWLGTGLIDENTEISFPVNKNLALIATWQGDIVEGFAQGTHELVRTVNRRTVLSANRFVYTPLRSDAISSLVNEYARSRPTIVIEQ